MTEPTFEELLSQLESSDETDRKFAVEDLGALKRPESIAPLAQRLMDSSASVREAAIEALIAVGSKDVAAALAPIVASEHVAGRNAALDVMVGIGRASIAAIHTSLLETDNGDLKKFGLDALLRIGELDPKQDARTISRVGDLLYDPNANVAGAAIEVLAMKADLVNPELFLNFVGKGSWLEMNALFALAQFPKEKTAPLLRKIDPGSLHPQSASVLKKMTEGL
jgi:HEAT repeat protein